MTLVTKLHVVGVGIQNQTFDLTTDTHNTVIGYNGQG